MYKLYYSFVLLYFIIGTQFNPVQSQVSLLPEYVLVQNGYSDIDSVLTGSIFDLSITNFCPGTDYLAIEFDNARLDFLGGVDSALYNLSSNYIQLNEGTTTCESCDPLAINFQFRFKPGVTCIGSTAGFAVIGHRECDSIINFEPKRFEIKAVAHDYWTYSVTERNPDDYNLQAHQREWRMTYTQNFSGATPVNGIYPSLGIGSHNLKLDSILVSLSSSACEDSTLLIDGYTPYIVFNPSAPNIPYTVPASPGSTLVFTPSYNDGVLLSNSGVTQYHFFVRGAVLTCDSCDYEAVFDSDAHLKNACGTVSHSDTITGMALYEQTIYSYNAELIKYLDWPHILISHRAVLGGMGFDSKTGATLL